MGCGEAIQKEDFEMFIRVERFFTERVQPVVSTIWGQLLETGRSLISSEQRRELPWYNIILIAPFDEEKTAMGRALLKEFGDNIEFDDTQMVLPLAPGTENGPVVYNLPGFHGERSAVTRRILGLAPALPSEAALPSEMDSPRVNFGASVILCAVDATITPLPQAHMERDVSQLKRVFGKRVVFAAIHKTKLEGWNRESRECRRKLLKGLLGDSLIYCELSTREGIDDVIAAISAGIA